MTRSTPRPDPDHDAVCASTARHRVVIAPPGTGKTHLAVRLAGTLAAMLPDPPVPGSTVGGRVLLLTFSNQARAQLEREATHQLTAAQRRRILNTNYHQMFWHAVRAHRTTLGLPLTVEVGSAARRRRALETADPAAAQSLLLHAGLLDAFAEHAFSAFQDHRTPGPDQLARLLAAIHQEQQAGRLIFDDFGALFWRLLDTHPTIEAAYRARFPVIIADEHQDASALQDAVVRRLAADTLIVLADPLQLIHGFRGARAERLDAHLRDSGSPPFELRTPHRWHTNPDTGAWLLAVRQRLLGHTATARRPAGVKLTSTPAVQGATGCWPPCGTPPATPSRADAAASRYSDAPTTTSNSSESI